MEEQSRRTARFQNGWVTSDCIRSQLLISPMLLQHFPLDQIFLFISFRLHQQFWLDHILSLSFTWASSTLLIGPDSVALFHWGFLNTYSWAIICFLSLASSSGLTVPHSHCLWAFHFPLLGSASSTTIFFIPPPPLTPKKERKVEDTVERSAWLQSLIKHPQSVPKHCSEPLKASLLRAGDLDSLGPPSRGPLDTSEQIVHGNLQSCVHTYIVFRIHFLKCSMTDQVALE
jgi:hypothetical protein